MRSLWKLSVYHSIYLQLEDPACSQREVDIEHRNFAVAQFDQCTKRSSSIEIGVGDALDFLATYKVQGVLAFNEISDHILPRVSSELKNISISPSSEGIVALAADQKVGASTTE